MMERFQKMAGAWHVCGTCVAGAWRHWDRILLCFEFNFCFKAIPVSWDRILLSFEFNCCCPVSWELYFFWIQEDSKMADASSGCCCLSGVKAVPSDLGAELSNCRAPIGPATFSADLQLTRPRETSMASQNSPT